VRLLETDTARALLDSTELARLAYVAADGTSRVLPMFFHWTGAEIVFATFHGAAKINALKARPAVAITIDSTDLPPAALLLRGDVTVAEVAGIVPEYASAQYRYLGPEVGAAAVADADRPGVRMARIALRPSWVGVLDFQTRFPGGTAEDFARRGL
jgi:hypothetical protein